MSEGVKGRAWGSNRANFDRNLAVVIGIDLYENDSIRNLSTAVSDAGAISFTSHSGYQIFAIRSTNPGNSGSPVTVSGLSNTSGF